MKYFISAGETSGDLHGSRLMSALKDLDASAEFMFLGGERMITESGTEPIIHIRDMAFMGFSEVLRHLGTIGRNLKKARQALRTSRADALILVDYPDFNLKLAAEAQKLGIPVYYYIPPKVWAWKSYRVKQMRKLCRRIFGIFPFEPEFYASHGAEAIYGGNPSVEEIDDFLNNHKSRQEFITDHFLTSRPIIALVPGSRMSEIRNNLPVMTAAVQPLREYQAVVVAAPGIPLDVYRSITNLPIVEGDTLNLMAHAQAALVTSGTATLECALADTPQVVCYRANGSRLSYELMRRILKVEHVSLPNLIAGKTIVPEMLLHRCTPALVGEELRNILPGSEGNQRMHQEYAKMRKALGTERAASTAAKNILKDLQTNTSNDTPCQRPNPNR